MTRALWTKANVVTFLRMMSIATTVNVEFPITKLGMLYFWKRSCSSKYCQAESLGSRQVDVGQIFFRLFRAMLTICLQITFLLAGLKENHIVTQKVCLLPCISNTYMMELYSVHSNSEDSLFHEVYCDAPGYNSLYW